MECHSRILLPWPGPYFCGPRLEILPPTFLLFFWRKADDKADSDLTLDQVATDLTPAAQCLSFFCGCWFWERWRFLQENFQFGEINHDLPCFATIWFLAPNVSRIFLKTTFYNYKTDSANGSPNCWSKIDAWNLWFQSGALMTTAFRVF